MTNRISQAARGVALSLSVAVMAVAITGVTPARAADQPSWMDPDLLAKAKKEGSVTIYSSINEKEGLVFWKDFTEATGIKVNYVRGSDTKLLARIAVEKRAGKEDWDVLSTTALNKMPKQWLAKIDPAQAKAIPDKAKDPDGRWIGIYANYNAIGYNTSKVKKSELPQTYEDFLKHPEWAGKVAVDHSDEEWLYALYKYYGADKGETLVKNIIKTLHPAVTTGHLAMARSLGAGEYAIALNNYVNLILNVKLRGGPVDFHAISPVAVFYGQIGINSKAPHPNAAMLAVNYSLSEQGQTHLTAAGRIPTRPGVETNPPGVMKAFEGKEIIPVEFSPEEAKKWSKRYKKLFVRR